MGINKISELYADFRSVRKSANKCMQKRYESNCQIEMSFFGFFQFFLVSCVKFLCVIIFSFFQWLCTRHKVCSLFLYPFRIFVKIFFFNLIRENSMFSKIDKIVASYCIHAYSVFFVVLY